MGREVRRVPLDFVWPLGKVWKGFINPHGDKSSNCEHCEGRGYSPEALHIFKQWYGYVPFQPEETGSTPFTPDHPIIRKLAERHIKDSPSFYGTGEAATVREATRLCAHFNKALSHHLTQADVDALVDEGRLVDFTHTWTREDGWQPKNPPYRPTAQEVNDWSLAGMGHDSINQWIVVKSRCKVAGIPEGCAHCNGTGTVWESPEAEQLYENWKQEEPPTGDGYQIWETVSEGSPVSPVFSTPEGLAKWMADEEGNPDVVMELGPHGQPVPRTVTNHKAYTKWLNFINGPGWAPTFVGSDKGLQTGVEFMATEGEQG